MRRASVFLAIQACRYGLVRKTNRAGKPTGNKIQRRYCRLNKIGKTVLHNLTGNVEKFRFQQCSVPVVSGIGPITPENASPRFFALSHAYIIKRFEISSLDFDNRCTVKRGIFLFSFFSINRKAREKPTAAAIRGAASCTPCEHQRKQAQLINHMGRPGTVRLPYYADCSAKGHP